MTYFFKFRRSSIASCKPTSSTSMTSNSSVSTTTSHRRKLRSNSTSGCELSRKSANEANHCGRQYKRSRSLDSDDAKNSKNDIVDDNRNDSNNSFYNSGEHGISEKKKISNRLNKFKLSNKTSHHKENKRNSLLTSSSKKLHGKDHDSNTTISKGFILKKSTSLPRSLSRKPYSSRSLNSTMYNIGKSNSETFVNINFNSHGNNSNNKKLESRSEFHNIGIGQILESPRDIRRRLYKEANDDSKTKLSLSNIASSANTTPHLCSKSEFVLLSGVLPTKFATSSRKSSLTSLSLRIMESEIAQAVW
eukprot:Awhi_evm1s3292